MDTATKTGIDAAKTASKRVAQKTAEATGDLIGNEIADKTISVGKWKKNKESRKNLHSNRKKTTNNWWLKIVLSIKFNSLCIKMEFLLDMTSDDKDLLRFVTKKWIEVYDQSGGIYNFNKEIRIKTPMLRSDLCDYSDAILLWKEILLSPIHIMQKETSVAFKNNAPFINCISKINSVQTDNAEDLDVVLSM